MDLMRQHGPKYQNVQQELFKVKFILPSRLILHTLIIQVPPLSNRHFYIRKFMSFPRSEREPRAVQLDILRKNWRDVRYELHHLQENIARSV